MRRPTRPWFHLAEPRTGFVLTRSHPNCVAPGKRPYDTIIPAIATKDKMGEPYLSYGVMSGYMQPQGHVQVLLNLVESRLSVQQALDSPRFCIGTGRPLADEESDDRSGAIDSTVFLEESIPASVLEELTRMGHNVTPIAGWARAQFGRGQVIQRVYRGGPEAKRAWAAGGDMRADGLAVAQV